MARKKFPKRYGEIPNDYISSPPSKIKKKNGCTIEMQYWCDGIQGDCDFFRGAPSPDETCCHYAVIAKLRNGYRLECHNVHARREARDG